jgi:membrane-associated protease RseP (regulator of RpoE activity)
VNRFDGMGIWTLAAPYLGIALGVWVIILLHELGHLLAARWLQVRVDVCSIGVGPTLLSYTSRSGTHLRFAALPLAGYLRYPLHKSSPEKNSETKRSSFDMASPATRSAILVAGPLSNFIFGILMFATIFLASRENLSLSLPEALQLSGVETYRVAEDIVIVVLHLIKTWLGFTEAAEFYFLNISVDSNLLAFVAYSIACLSVATGLFNLLPIPPLDGGYLLQISIAVSRDVLQCRRRHHLRIGSAQQRTRGG